MNIKVLLVGKTDKEYIREGIDVFLRRLSKYGSVSMVYLKGLSKSKSYAVPEIKKEETRQIMENLSEKDYNILLDEKGKHYSSREFARELQALILQGNSKITFIIGGAYGVDQGLFKHIKLKLSLSKMTFSHQMVRLIFMEQLYRAFTIINNEPYHHD